MVSAGTELYLAREVVFVNPSYLRWKNKPPGEITWPQFTKVTLLHPNWRIGEDKFIRQSKKIRNLDMVVVSLSGQRVFIERDILLTRAQAVAIRRDQG
jgi:hypothetical protein